VKKILMGDGTLVLDGDDVSYELITDVTFEELEKIRDLPGVGFRFDPVRSDDETKLIMKFDMEEGFMIYDRVRLDLNPSSKLRVEIAKRMCLIGEHFQMHQDQVTLFHPLNFFVHQDDGTVLVLYRGIKGMPASGYEDEPIVEHVKRLILLLFTTARFEELLLNGNGYANRRPLEEYRHIVRCLAQAKSLDDVKKCLEEEERRLKEEEEKKLAEAEQEKKKKPLIQQLTNKQKMIAIGGLAVLVIVSTITFTVANADSGQELPNGYIQGLRAASVGDYSVATQSFDRLNFNSLSKQDKEVVLQVYVEANQVNKAKQLAGSDPELRQVVEEAVQNNNSGPEIPNGYIQGLRAASVGDYSVATQSLDRLDFNSLSKQDKEVVLQIYVEANQVNKAKQLAGSDPELMQVVEETVQYNK
jgi:ethanolamine utilization microcompartment shell protein EutS